MVLKFGHLEYCIKNTWKVLKCGSLDGWRRRVWTDRVRNGKVLCIVKKDRNIRRTIKKRKAKWFGHILGKNCLLNHVIEENVRGGGDRNDRKTRKKM
jgi:hypothetical protein